VYKKNVGLSANWYAVWPFIKKAAMTIDNNRVFIENKLNEISSAVMYSESNNIAKLPNDVVMFIKLDDCGQLWFKGHKPRNWIRTYEQNFPAKLFFYRKGVDYYMETTGTATIVSKEEKTDLGNIGSNSLLFKMTPSFIEYVETGKRRPLSEIYRSGSQFYNWLMHLLPGNNSNSFKFSSPQKTKNYGSYNG
jgi:hypothetical protein